MKKLAWILISVLSANLFICCGRQSVMEETYKEQKISQESASYASDEETQASEEYFPEEGIREFYIESLDGIKLYARIFFVSAENHKWVIGCHGVNSNKEELQKMADYYTSHGYNALLLDLRGFGKSEGKTTLGYYESTDIIQWCYYLQKLDPSCEVYLHGLSLGAVSVLRAAADYTLPKWVKACVADSAHCSVLQEYEYLKSIDSLHEFTMQIKEIQDEIESEGIALEEISALNAVAKAQIPVLIFHGQKDEYVPISQAYQLAEACSQTCKIIVYENARHVVYNIADKEYWHEIDIFFSDK